MHALVAIVGAFLALLLLNLVTYDLGRGLPLDDTLPLVLWTLPFTVFVAAELRPLRKDNRSAGFILAALVGNLLLLYAYGEGLDWLQQREYAAAGCFPGAEVICPAPLGPYGLMQPWEPPGPEGWRAAAGLYALSVAFLYLLLERRRRRGPAAEG